jgi:predicted MFS family arabinose efflux permease
VVLLRIPIGFLPESIAAARLVHAGHALTTVAIALLIQPPSTLVLVIAGVLIGSGAGLIITPLLVELGRRSDASNRGSAFALYSAAVAGAHATGSIVAAPLVALAGFEAAVLLAGIGVAAAAAVTVGDRGLWRRTVTA